LAYDGLNASRVPNVYRVNSAIAINQQRSPSAKDRDYIRTLSGAERSGYVPGHIENIKPVAAAPAVNLETTDTGIIDRILTADQSEA
jgi:hypothetical protein